MAAAAAAAALAWRACAPRPAPPFCQQRRALPPGTNYFLQRDFAVNLLYAGRGGAEAPARASGEARLPAAAARCLGALPWLRAGPRAAWRQVQGAVPWRAASHFGSAAARLSSAPGLAWAMRYAHAAAGPSCRLAPYAHAVRLHGAVPPLTRCREHLRSSSRQTSDL